MLKKIDFCEVENLSLNFRFLAVSKVGNRQIDAMKWEIETKT